MRGFLGPWWIQSSFQYTEKPFLAKFDFCYSPTVVCQCSSVLQGDTSFLAFPTSIPNQTACGEDAKRVRGRKGTPRPLRNLTLKTQCG